MDLLLYKFFAQYIHEYLYPRSPISNHIELAFVTNIDLTNLFLHIAINHFNKQIIQQLNLVFTNGWLQMIAAYAAVVC
ncbi:hypothetical protein D3C78_1368810 [compost metagenome]